MNSQPTFLILTAFFNSMKLPYYQKPDNQIRKSDNFESHNSQNLGFTNIRGLLLSFVECESFLESNSPDIFALYEANSHDSIDS